jgi:nicotinamidase-related amidase
MSNPNPETLKLDTKTSALVLIDLQYAIMGRATAPYTTSEVVERSARLAQAFREKGGIVVYVHVDVANMLQLPVDRIFRDPNAPAPPPNAKDIVPEAGIQPGDLLVLKNNWGAFFGTNLEAQLREKGITTVVLGGVATNYGVESTARAAAGLGFALVVVEDACTSLSPELHRFPFDNVFPMLSRVRSTQEVIDSLE